MAKNVVQDVVPGKRSIRDVSLPSRRKTDDIRREPEHDVVRERPVDIVRKPAPASIVEDEDVRTIDRPTHDKTSDIDVPRRPMDYDFDYDVDRPSKKNKWGIFALGAVFILALVFGIVSMFASAKVSIIPKSQNISLQSSFTAPKDQPTGVFGYQIVSVSKTTQEDVTAGAQAQSDTKASGTIVIFNSSNTVQNLVATTRFQTTAGLVYRITQPVTVPKATTVSGTVTPGSATANVVADQSGASYNIGLSDFTLPGLKGTARYVDVVAHSKTPMTGGFSGMRKSVDTATLSQATTDMQNSLRTDLASQITAQLPQNFVLFPSSVSYSFADVTQVPATDPNKATLSLTGTASAVIFDRVLLSQKIIASIASSTAIDGQAEVQNISDMAFTLTQPTTISKDYTGPISFQLSGNADIVWLFDQTALKNDITGIKKSDLNALLQAKYPSIMQAQAKIFPVWKGTFPADPSKITISEVSSF
jgi:hypothetical protein